MIASRWVAAAAVLLIGPALASSGTVVLVTTMPSAHFGTAAAWGGQDAYYFGGWSHFPLDTWDQIVRVDPDYGTLTVLGATLPAPTAYADSFVYDGEIYLVGGQDGWPAGQSTRPVMRFDPATETLAIQTATIPQSFWTTAAFDGAHAYIFQDNPGGAILRYTPATGAVATMPESLPNQHSTRAAWHGDSVYLFGGWSTSERRFMDEITRYTPATGAMEVLDLRMPVGRYMMAAVAVGEGIYVYGGARWTLENTAGEVDTVYFFDPAAETLTPQATIPQAMAASNPVWTGDDALLVGGSCFCQAVAATDGPIYRFSP